MTRINCSCACPATPSTPSAARLTAAGATRARPGIIVAAPVIAATSDDRRAEHQRIGRTDRVDLARDDLARQVRDGQTDRRADEREQPRPASSPARTRCRAWRRAPGASPSRRAAATRHRRRRRRCRPRRAGSRRRRRSASTSCRAAGGESSPSTRSVTRSNSTAICGSKRRTSSRIGRLERGDIGRRSGHDHRLSTQRQLRERRIERRLRFVAHASSAARRPRRRSRSLRCADRAPDSRRKTAGRSDRGPSDSASRTSC